MLLHLNNPCVLLKKNNLENAEEEIKKAIALKPNNAMYRLNLGLVFLIKGHPDPAIVEAWKALRMDRDSWQAYLLISDAFKAKGEQRAADHFHETGRRLQIEQSRTAGKSDIS